MLHQAPRAITLALFLFCLSCYFLPVTVHAQDRPYSAPVVLQVTAPGSTEPITVTVQIAVILPVGNGTAGPATLPLTITQAAVSSGAVKVVSVRPAQPIESGRAVALTPGTSPLTGLVATPTPQLPVASTAVANAEQTPEPVQGVVNDVANLRMGPGTSYAVAGKAQVGDAKQVVGKSADGEWYKLAGGEWIAAFLVDVEGVVTLPVVDAPSEVELWPRYKMISGAFSFAYPPQFTVSNEEEDSVTLTSGATGFAPTLQIGYISDNSQPDLSDYDAAIRILKTAITQLSDFDHRFTGDGTIDTEGGGVYLAGVASGDNADIGFVTALIPAGTNYALVWYIRIGSTDIEAEALPILAGLSRSVRTSSSSMNAIAPVPTEMPSKEVFPDDAPPTVTSDVLAASRTGASDLNRFMVGNAIVPLPAPSSDKVEIIELGRTEQTLYMLVRNNTDTPITSVSVNTVVRGSDGTMLAVEDSLGSFDPKLINPGEVAFGYVYFSNFTLPDDAKFQYDVTWSSATTSESYGDLFVAEVNLVGNRFVGMLRNDSQEKANWPIEAVALCFNAQGVFLFDASEIATQNVVQAGETIPFQIELRDTCPYYLIFASGLTY